MSRRATIRTSLNASYGRNQRRRGSALLVVLVVVMVLSLAAYSFTATMVTEVDATTMYGRDVQTRAFADSGIELAAAMLGTRFEETTPPNFYDNPDFFQGVLMRDAESDRGRGRFSLVAPLETDVTASTMRFGLMDESAKLNLNTLLDRGLSDDELRDVLLTLPEMTVEIADAILDWLDEDEQPREFGAENEYYGTLDPPYAAKNGPLESLDELLLVRGVTPWLLYGEDANRNGLLDANENDADATAPLDDADSVLLKGWSADLTLFSREANLRSDGTPKINVNGDDLAALYDSLAEEFDEDTARFVVAYRIYGSNQQQGNSSGGGGSTAASPSQGGGAQRAGSVSDGSPGGGGQDSAAQRGGAQGRGSQGGGSQGGGSGGGQSLSGASQQSGGGSGGSGSGGRDIRNGLDVSQSGQNQIASLYDLIGAEVNAQINGAQRVLQSPFTTDPSDMQRYLPAALDALSVTAEPLIEGRININLAPREVLLTIPQMDEQTVEIIVGEQMANAGSDPGFDPTGRLSTTAWLLTEGHVNLETMKALDRFITARGDVYRVQSIGYFDAGGPVTRLEAIIDATQMPPKVIRVRDLTPLGGGDVVQILNQSAMNP